MQVLKTQLAAKKEGYADVVYLDAKTDTFLEEVSSCNIFTVQGKTIRTPPIEVRDAGCRLLFMPLSGKPSLSTSPLALPGSSLCRPLSVSLWVRPCSHCACDTS